MRVKFFTKPALNRPSDVTPAIVDAEYSLVLVPQVGDFVSFDEGDHEYHVAQRLVEIDDHGHQIVTVMLS